MTEKTVASRRGRPPTGTPMTPREKMQAFRQRMKERGLKEVKVFVPDGDEGRIQRAAADLRIEAGRTLPGDEIDGN